MIVLATSSLGFYFVKLQKERIVVCNDLIGLCDELLIQLSFSMKPIKDIILSSNLDYLSVDNISSISIIATPLSYQENEKISHFLYQLGKSDAKSQTKTVNSFKDYLLQVRGKYVEKSNSKSKVYISFGVCSGIILSLALI